MKIKFTGITDKIAEGVELLASPMGFDIVNGDKTIYSSNYDKGFKCIVTGENAEILYHTPADFFRALSIVIDAFKNNKNIEITQSPAFETCGIMLDVSRGAVIKPEMVKKIIRFIARMGFNRLMLYAEDIYEMKKYPYFGYMRGRYTADELKNIVSYADKFGIETIPCIQTLAHLEYPLRWADFSDIIDNGNVLLIGEDKTYELLEEMIKTMRECFTSKQIHIGMDEAHGVGLGNYFLKHGYRNRFDLLSEHLNKVLEICKKYDFSPMMWSDMFFRIGSKENNYYDWDNKLPENISDLIPDGVTQVYWDYYNHSENLYDLMLSEHKKMGCPIIFAGGVWTWSSPSINNVQTFESTIPALNACRNQGIRHVLATMWGDDGSECDVLQSLYGLQLFAEYNYNVENALDMLDSMFSICTGYNAELFKLLDVDDFGLPTYSPERAEFVDIEAHIINISKQILYSNPLMGMFDKNIEGLNLKSHYYNLLKKLEALKIPEDLKTMFDSHRQFVKVLYDKCDIGLRLKKAYDSRDADTLKVICDELIVLETNLSDLCTLRMALWMENNKPFGYEKVARRLATISEFVHISYTRVNAYINGIVDKLEELEQERLYYNNIDRPYFLEYFSDRIMMP